MSNRTLYSACVIAANQISIEESSGIFGHVMNGMGLNNSGFQGYQGFRSPAGNENPNPHYAFPPQFSWQPGSPYQNRQNVLFELLHDSPDADPKNPYYWLRATISRRPHAVYKNSMTVGLEVHFRQDGRDLMTEVMRFSYNLSETQNKCRLSDAIRLLCGEVGDIRDKSGIAFKRSSNTIQVGSESGYGIAVCFNQCTPVEKTMVLLPMDAQAEIIENNPNIFTA